MAIIQLQEPFKSFRGRDEVTGGQVLYPFRRRNVSRTMVVPFNPSTTFQDDIRAIFTALTQEYSNVSDADNAGWITLAQSLTHNDKDGNPVIVQAKAAFIQINFWTLLEGSPINHVAPTYATVPGILTTSVLKRNVANTGWQFTYAWDGPNTDIALKNTPPLPGLRRQPRETDFRFSDSDPTAALVPITAAGGTITILDTASRFNLPTGSRIGYSAQVISPTFIPLQTFQFQGTLAAP